MIDFRKFIVSIVISVLLAVFVFTGIESVYPSPEYRDFCDEFGVTPVYKSIEGMNESEMKNYNAQLAAEREAQKQCSDAFDAAKSKFDFIKFLISAVIGLVAIVIGLFVPLSSGVGMSVSSGLLLGGLFTLFFGTVSGWDGIGRITRPVVIFIEIIIVIFVSYKKLGDKKN